MMPNAVDRLFRPAMTPAFVFFIALASPTIPASAAKEPPKPSAAVVADGHAWTMTMVRDNKQMQLTLLPDGTGTMASPMRTMSPKWRATSDGLCLKPSLMISEHCVVLVSKPGGYDGIEEGKLVFELRR